jgi:hypothetical protein
LLVLLTFLFTFFVLWVYIQRYRDGGGRRRWWLMLLHEREEIGGSVT